MTSPKPIKLTHQDPEDYEGLEPQPFVVIGDAPSAAPDYGHIPFVTEYDATDEATAIALANANKSAINAVIRALSGGRG